MVAEEVVPTRVKREDIRRHSVRQPSSRTRAQKSADGFDPRASIAVHLEREIERAYRPDVIAGNLPEGSLIEKPGAASSEAGRRLSSRSRRVAAIAMTG